VNADVVEEGDAGAELGHGGLSAEADAAGVAGEVATAEGAMGGGGVACERSQATRVHAISADRATL